MVQFFANHRISWQWVDGNLYYVFCSIWPEWNFLITQRSQVSFFSFFSCFLERACTSLLVFELILTFPIFLKKVMYISKGLYIAEKRSKPVLIWWPLWPRKRLIRLRSVSWPFVLLFFWSLSYFRLGLFFVWLYDLAFKVKELNFSLPITKKLWLVFIRF